MNMELMGAMGEGEWGSLSGMYYSTEEADFMAQLLSIPSEPEGSSGLWPAHESVDGSFYSSDNMDANLYYHLNESHPKMVGSLDFSMEGPKSSDGFPGRVLADDPMGADDCLNEGTGGNLLHEFALPDKNSQVERDTVMEDGKNQPENSKKRPRSSANVPKKKRNAKSKKSSNPVSVGEDSASNGGLNANSSSSCCSEDETSMASQDQNGGVSSSSAALKGKTRASRGSATDPQSLYARKRRERINERLRILQNLVPNGTKVDISTMLEEAVQYVKFLQLQIKLLSSDDLWMYAPIAYNGMNIGLDMNLTTPR